MEKTKTTIIGFTGALESGKSTSAKIATSFLEDRFESLFRVETMAFAEPFKKIMLEYFGFYPYQVYTPEGKAETHPLWNMTAREFMQRFGAGMRKSVAEDIWVKTAEVAMMRSIAKAEKAKYDQFAIVFDDVRQDNEAEMIRRHGGRIIKVIRPGHAAKTVGIQGHESEKGLSENLIDYLVINDGGMDKLRVDVIRTVSTFL